MKDSYSLRQVVDLTGISEFTLRGWENRYGAFSPKRTSTGRRKYSGLDLQKAMLLRELLKRDQRIGEIAHFNVKKLSEILDDLGLMENRDDSSVTLSSEADQILKLTALQKWDEVEKYFRSHHKKSPLDSVHSLVLPVLKSLNQAVISGIVTISQEHILSALLKEYIYHLRSRAPQPNSSSRVLLASPEGDFHEIGILMAHLLVSLHGIRSLFLGPNTPKNELAETALRFGATHVILGSTISRKEGAKEDLATYVHFLNKHLPEQVALWIGGRNSRGFQAQLSRSHKFFKSLEDLEQSIKSDI